MSSNYKQPGDTVTLTAPTGGVTAGGVTQIGGLLVVAAQTALVGVEFEGQRVGIFELPKTTGTAWVEGDALYYDLSAEECGVVAGLGPYIGMATADVASGVAVGDVLMNAGTDLNGVFALRRRLAIADINAGTELLPAIPGLKYRMLDASMLAFGGAVTSVTTVDLLMTQTTPVKVMAGGVAALLEGVLIKVGHTGGVDLAAGLSFVAADVNTAVTVDITGSDITVATHVDVMMLYQLDV